MFWSRYARLYFYASFFFLSTARQATLYRNEFELARWLGTTRWKKKKVPAWVSQVPYDSSTIRRVWK